jgi:molybdate transport system regulatory protein
MGLNEKKGMSTQPQWLEASLKLTGVNHRMMILLQAIAQTGSISQGAKQAGLSYKGAWQIIERANNLAPNILVKTTMGGNGGGGAYLTPAGFALVTLFNQLQEKHQQFLDNLNHQIASHADLLTLLKRCEIKTSVVNQIFGRIKTIDVGEVSAEVALSLKNGKLIYASVDKEVLIEMNLKIDDDALVLVDSHDITLSLADWKLSARNQLEGEIVRFDKRDQIITLTISLGDGESFLATMNATETQHLTLKTTMPIRLAFKSNAVTLATRTAI